MRAHGLRILASLRRWRHIVAAAVLPAVLASALSGIACPAIGAPAATHEHPTHAAYHSVGGHTSQADHAHHAAAPTAPSGDCPHCLGGDATANLGDASCAVAAPALATHALPASPLALAAPARTHVSVIAAPPLIRKTSPPDDAFVPAVPLRIRHCVLLI